MKNQDRKKKIFALHAQSATTSQADFAVIGVQLCSTITCILVMEHFLIELNVSRFCILICNYIQFFEWQVFLVSGYVGVGNSSFLMKGIFFRAGGA